MLLSDAKDSHFSLIISRNITRITTFKASWRHACGSRSPMVRRAERGVCDAGHAEQGHLRPPEVVTDRVLQWRPEGNT